MEKKGSDRSATGKSVIENGNFETKVSSSSQSLPQSPAQASSGPPQSPAQASSEGSTPNSPSGQHVRVQVPLATALQGFIMQEPTGEPMLGPDGQPVLVRLVPVEGGRFAGQMIVAGKLHESVNVSLSSPIGCQNGETACISNGIPTPKSPVSQTSDSSSKSYNSGLCVAALIPNLCVGSHVSCFLGNSTQSFSTPATMQPPKVQNLCKECVVRPTCCLVSFWFDFM